MNSSDQYIEEMFADHTGAVARVLSGYAAREGQIQLARAIHHTIVDGNVLLGEAPTGCHAAGQGILMFDGTVKKVEDVVKGDQLMGPDSCPRTVLRLVRGIDEMVEIRPTKGSPWKVNRGHILSLQRTNTQKFCERKTANKIRKDCKHGNIVDVSVKDWEKWSKTQKHIYKLFRVPVSFQPSKEPLPIPAYFFGLLLGDGSLGGTNAHGSVGVTNVDQEPVAAVYAYAEAAGMTVRASLDRAAPTYYLQGTPQVRRNPLITRLRNMGLYGCTAHDKFIPHRYKIGSERERLDLLAGFFDADMGLVGNVYATALASQQLADDVAFIARSLGFGVTRRVVTKRCTNSTVGHSGVYYQISVYGDIDRIPCNIPRKQGTKRRQVKSVLRTGFEVKKLSEHARYYGFRLDGDQRYLLDDFTVTHNCGKSLAYLIPAIMNGLKTRQRVLVVTANKALQEQLMDKDLPLLVRVFEEYNSKLAFSYQLVKGRANYLCQQELAAYDSGVPLAGIGLDELGEAQALSAWGQTTITGDQSDAPAAVSQRTWNAFSVSGERCTRRACPFHETCFAERIAERARVADVVVANYDLLFSKLKANDPMWAIFGIVILDEAHEAADIARRCFGRELGLGHLNQLASDISKYLGDRGLAKQMRDTAGPFFEEIARYVLNTDTPRVCEPNFIAAADLVDVVDDAMRAAKGRCGLCSEDPGCGMCAYRTLIHDRAKMILEYIQEFVGQTDTTTAYWIDRPPEHTRVTAATVRLHAVPYRVGDRLSTEVFTKYPTVIAVSATMTSGGTFDFVRDELGLVASSLPPEDQSAGDSPSWEFSLYGQSTGSDAKFTVKGLRVPSPFDFAKQAKFIVPLGIPWPIPENDELFNRAAADAIKTLIVDCKGRLLALFTSWRRLKYVAERLTDNIDYPLFVQGDAPNKMLAQMFRDQTNSVMLATRSFWMGLDVQGESLSCLVIDKLPLESFADPLVDMMKQRHPDTFWSDFYFPRAAITLAQGAGRLIRSTTDRGVFVLLDARIIAKSYGGMMRRSLPFAGFSKNLADAGKFLSGSP